MNRRNDTARSVALHSLLRMKNNDGYSNIVLDNALKTSNLNVKDKSLASAIFYGVLEKQITLDYFINQSLKNPERKLDPVAKEALRCGVYQILFLDRVPNSAAVNETVNAVKLIGKPGLSGLVNGVLRGLLRKKDDILIPDDNSLSALSIRYSLPQELIEFWIKSYGERFTMKLLNSLSKKPELYVRINNVKTEGNTLLSLLDKDGVKLKLLSELPGAGVFENCSASADITKLAAFNKGLFHVQDLSAQYVCKLLDPMPGDIVCDCCAAPGGKTFTIAQQLGNGRIYSMDLHESRVKLIQMGATRLGLENIECRVNDAVKGFGNMPAVDKMLCDVPCSGFGVIRRKPEIRYKSLNTLKKLPQLQYAILCKAAEKVKPGGMLIYSTCTLNPAENGNVAEQFLKENNGYEPMNIDLGLKRSIDEPEYMLTMTPFAGASDGFFAAAFRKRNK